MSCAEVDGVWIQRHRQLSLAGHKVEDSGVLVRRRRQRSLAGHKVEVEGAGQSSRRHCESSAGSVAREHNYLLIRDPDGMESELKMPLDAVCTGSFVFSRALNC
eukprot:4632403-Amphidinium_carterae.1